MSEFSKSITVMSEYVQNVFGQFDVHAKKIEKAFHVSMILRDDKLKISGEEKDVEQAVHVLIQLFAVAARGTAIDEQKVDYTIAMSKDHPQETQENIAELDRDIICHTINGKPIKPKTHGQKAYVNAIDKSMIVFGVGPAGTGKTYLAMAKAITAFKNGEVNRIILTRPAIEAGEKLGFLPGDLQSKVDPYLRPLYDALFDMLGADTYQKYLERGNIEVAPLAYMRGRTLDDSFIILDEAQNTSREQMKMFLTRIGFGSKVVITGDITQIDLPEDKVSGLKIAMKVLDGIDDISICKLTGADVVRHQLVQKIIEAYEVYDKKNPPEPAAKSGPYRRKKQ